MSDRKLNDVKRIARKKGILGEISISAAKGKRFAIKVEGRTLNFGLWPFGGTGTYIDHRDEKIRAAWRARHSKILKTGKPAYLNPSSPEYYAWHLLW